MRPRGTAGIAHQSDDLPAPHGVTDSDQSFAQMKIRCDDATTVIDVDDVAGEKKVVDEHDDSAIGNPHRLSDATAKIDPKVTRGQSSVEGPTRAELARDHRRAGLEE